MNVMNRTEKKFVENLSFVLEMIDKNESKSNICRLLKVKQSTLNNYLIKYNIEYIGNQSRKGITHPEQVTHYTDYTEKGKNISTSKLRLKLIEQGVKEQKCEKCGLDKWMDKPIPLELHHIDENRFNNKLENLQILCSNCHMQTHDYSNTKKLFQKPEKVKKINNCSCGNKIDLRSELCVNCSKIKQRKTERPPYEKLIDDINNLGYSRTGKKYDVSDNTIRKWISYYNKELSNTPLAE
jgi:5-methylcytosine-specific restriction endonuclease McrA